MLLWPGRRPEPVAEGHTGWLETHSREVAPYDPSMPHDPLRLPPATEWFAPDAERHLLDKPKYSPMSTLTHDKPLTSEWWNAHERVFLTWCAACKWTGNVVLFKHAIIEEPEH